MDFASEATTATMQTSEPLRRAPLSVSSRSVQWPLYLFESGEIELSAPYQRSDVWGPVRRRNLIRSLLQGVPIPAVVVNDRLSAGMDNFPAGSAAYAVVDGKQRLTAIIDFQRDELAIPASWYEPELVESVEDCDDGPYVRFSGLTRVGRRLFRNLPLGVVEGRMTSVEEEEELFNLVNFGGVPQGGSDLP